MKDRGKEETDRLEEALRGIGEGGARAEAGMTVLYDLMAPRMMRAAFTLTGSQADAEDVLQESMLKLFRQPGLYVPSGHPQAYILTVVRHSALDLVRRKQRELSFAASPEEEPVAPPDRQTDLAAVADMLSVLEADDRLIVTLRLYEELSYREIARILKITVAAAQKRYQRAVAVLRRTYTERETTHENE